MTWSLLEHSGINSEDALRRLHVRDKNGNLHMVLSIYFNMEQFPRLKWQTYAYLLKALVLFHFATFGYKKFQIVFSKLSNCQITANIIGKTKT